MRDTACCTKPVAVPDADVRPHEIARGFVEVSSGDGNQSGLAQASRFEPALMHFRCHEARTAVPICPEHKQDGARNFSFIKS